jgi:hypothetical protein
MQKSKEKVKKQTAGNDADGFYSLKKTIRDERRSIFSDFDPLCKNSVRGTLYSTEQLHHSKMAGVKC